MKRITLGMQLGVLPLGVAFCADCTATSTNTGRIFEKERPAPFVWTKTADEIVAKLTKLSQQPLIRDISGRRCA